MTKEDIRPDTDTLGGLDFEPVCELQTGYLLFGQPLMMKPCENPAAWAGFYPCCGRATLVCQSHHDLPNPHFCAACRKRHASLINWTHL